MVFEITITFLISLPPLFFTTGRHVIWYDVIRCHRPAYPDRLFLIMVGNAVNWSLVGYGKLTVERVTLIEAVMGFECG